MSFPKLPTTRARLRLKKRMDDGLSLVEAARDVIQEDHIDFAEVWPVVGEKLGCTDEEARAKVLDACACG